MTIRCHRCQTEKDESDFQRNRAKPNGRQGYCRPCMNLKNAESKARHIERLRPVLAARQRAKRKADPERLAANDKRSCDKIRAACLAAYGGKCVCCGEAEPLFLAVDHIYGDGAEHRRTIGSGTSIYRWLRDHGYPRDRFQLLCHNCNMAKGFYGECPHAAARRA
jgi:hypothetical protein